MSVDINTIKRHDRVRLPEGEEGRVAKVDHDANVVWVDIAVDSTFGGKVTDTVDIDPDEPNFVSLEEETA